MEFRFIPQGVCSTEYIITVENNIIKDIKIANGCHGNLQGIASLITGMNIDEVIAKLKGIKCRNKNTSCPDQIAIALEQIKTRM